MPGLFDWLNAINTGSSLVIDDSSPDPYKEYVPFQINNGLSQNNDTVLMANEMNKRPWLSKELQFKFLNSAVSKRKRFAKWAKLEADGNKEDIEALCEYYSVNKYRAAEYLKLLTPENIGQIKKFLNKGGAETKGRSNAKRG